MDRPHASGSHHVVVLGAGYAGLAAAKRVAHRMLAARRDDVRVTLVNDNDRFVERVRLHQLAAGQHLRDLPLAHLLAGTGIELVVARLTAVDPTAQTVTFDKAPHTINYDTLVYALGSTASVPDYVAPNAFSVATRAEALRLRAHVGSTQPGDPLTVVGGGLTGIETAAELAEAHPGRQITLVTGAQTGSALSERGQRYVRKGLTRLGVRVHEHARVVDVSDSSRLVLANGYEIPAGTVVWAVGFAASPIARNAGLAVDERGRIVVDDSLRSVSHPDVFAAGDAAVLPERNGREPRMCCQTALPSGWRVADSIQAVLAGRDPKPIAPRYVWQNISLGRSDGLTQFVRSDDTPVEVVCGGRLSAYFKEVITQGTITMLRRAARV